MFTSIRDLFLLVYCVVYTRVITVFIYSLSLTPTFIGTARDNDTHHNLQRSKILKEPIKLR